MHKAKPFKSNKPFKKPWLERLFGAVIVFLSSYILLAYFVLPAWWRNYEHEQNITHN